MENSREDGLSGPTHDPHEVTVQLDVSGRQLGGPVGVRPGEGGSGAGGGEGRAGREGADDKELPVFVDDSGRRGRNFRRFGVAAGLAIAVYAVVIVVTVFSGNSDAPWLPMPAEGKGAGKVGTRSSEPTPSTSTAQSPGATPESSATGSAVPGASAAPGASASPSAGDSASGKPSTGTSPSGRPTGGKTTPPVDPSGPADSDEPSTDPSEPTDPTTPPDDTVSDPAGGPGTDGSETLAEGGLVQLLVAPLVQPLDSLVPSLESSVL
ncbi:hypothetical protein OG785_22095 [Streptomyces sp. NBC_00006]|uniref:hypothetical protein n=1 Tax=Streptomyces sp. NBC_00006 TaxID=2975619 RepID=UPI002253FBEA|nr:hypothetical protein [Streptomyces sp. NBC_00006]MCX5533234.1 hypothetical protein [Streptomyces sp. NBC_00006]